MSNMQQYGAAKNPPWARSSTTQGQSQGLAGMQGQVMGQMGALGSMGMVQYQQPQVFQSMMQQGMGAGSGMSMQMQQNMASGGMAQSGYQNTANTSGLGVVSYPTPRVLNQAFNQQGSNTSSGATAGQAGGPPTKQRVFTGTVTKAHNDFGFVDEDVFFQTSACVKGSYPAVGDRVLVEASYNSSMPFKWNATRIQVLPLNNLGSGSQGRRDSMPKGKTFITESGGGYNAVPPPDSHNGSYGSSGAGGPDSRSRPRTKQPRPDRPRMQRDPSPRQSDDNDRKRKRPDRGSERSSEKPEEKEKARSPRRSSKARRRTRPVARYLVQVPKIALDIPEADVLEVRRRYGNLYIPSDFFNTQFRWIDAFPPTAPFGLDKPCAFHVMHKDINNPVANDAVLEPPDVDYLFSAKVMLLSMPSMDEVYRRCCSLANGTASDEKDPDERDFIHPTRLISFLVGLRGTNETMAIGGPWSPSLDGVDPAGDPSVLIKTAIRTCKAHTGIDLSNCTQWYRFVELYYRRAESVHRGKAVPARVETVVVYLPDVWSCLPTGLEWEALGARYQQQAGGDPNPAPSTTTPQQNEKKDETEKKKEPTHYSQLDVKTMTLVNLRKELWARNLNNKGLKSQLTARLSKVLKAEESGASEAGEGDAEEDVDMETDAASTAAAATEDATDEKLDEEKQKELALWRSRHSLPSAPHMIVHPSRTAKSGKFDCTAMTLSLLLDYRPEDSKEHSFEVSLFAELFNEMLMRDFGFNIYKALYVLPDKPKEEKDDKKKDSDDKKKDSDEKKKDGDSKKSDADGKKDGDSRKTDEKEKSVTPVSNGDDKKDKKDKRDDGSESDDDKKSSRDKGRDRDRERREKRLPRVTADPQLLLSFVYFDTSHCGYIFEKDMEELLYTLGLSLSRSQVRRLVAKCINRDSFHYRHLTDKVKEEEVNGADDKGTEKAAEKVAEPKKITDAEMAELASGNKKLLPVFKTEKSVSSENKSNDTTVVNEGLVSYRGGLLDIEKLMGQLKRSEEARVATEARLTCLKAEKGAASEEASKLAASVATLTASLDTATRNLQEANSQLKRAQMCSKIFHTALKEIDTKVMSVIHTNLYDDNDSKIDVKSEIKSDTGSRWSSDVPESTSKDIDIKHE